MDDYNARSMQEVCQLWLLLIIGSIMTYCEVINSTGISIETRTACMDGELSIEMNPLYKMHV